jgi:hypothetical protein
MVLSSVIIKILFIAYLVEIPLKIKLFQSAPLAFDLDVFLDCNYSIFRNLCSRMILQIHAWIQKS